MGAGSYVKVVWIGKVKRIAALLVSHLAQKLLSQTLGTQNYQAAVVYRQNFKTEPHLETLKQDSVPQLDKSRQPVRVNTRTGIGLSLGNTDFFGHHIKILLFSVFCFLER